MSKQTLYTIIGTGKNRETGAAEEYPAILVTNGTGRDWKLSSLGRLNKILDLIVQSGGDPAKVPVESGNKAIKNLKQAVVHLQRSGSTGRALPPSVKRV